MSGPLVSQSEIESLREYALTGMQTEIQIFRKVSVAGDYGDDEESFSSTPDAVVMGWFRNAPNLNLTDEMGALQQIDDGRLFVPVGTDISRGDKVVIEGNAWSVIDTSEESTYKVLLRASLRRES